MAVKSETMTRSLYFPFFHGLEGFEMLVTVSPPRDRDEGDDCAVQIKINGIRVHSSHADPLGHFKFTVDAPELGPLDRREVYVELEFGIIKSALKGRAEVVGLDGLETLTKSFSAVGDLVEKGVQRLDWEFVFCGTSYILSYKFRSSGCQLFLNGFPLWESKSSSLRLGSRKPASPGAVVVSEKGLGVVHATEIVVRNIRLEKGLLVGEAEIDGRSLGDARFAKESREDCKFEPLRQPRPAGSHENCANVHLHVGNHTEATRPRKVTEITQERRKAIAENSQRGKPVSRGQALMHSVSVDSGYRPSLDENMQRLTFSSVPVPGTPPFDRTSSAGPANGVAFSDARPHASSAYPALRVPHYENAAYPEVAHPEPYAFDRTCSAGCGGSRAGPHDGDSVSYGGGGQQAVYPFDRTSSAGPPYTGGTQRGVHPFDRTSSGGPPFTFGLHRVVYSSDRTSFDGRPHADGPQHAVYPFDRTSSGGPPTGSRPSSATHPTHGGYACLREESFDGSDHSANPGLEGSHYLQGSHRGQHSAMGRSVSAITPGQHNFFGGAGESNPRPFAARPAVGPMGGAASMPNSEDLRHHHYVPSFRPTAPPLPGPPDPHDHALASGCGHHSPTHGGMGSQHGQFAPRESGGWAWPHGGAPRTPPSHGSSADLSSLTGTSPPMSYVSSRDRAGQRGGGPHSPRAAVRLPGGFFDGGFPLPPVTPGTGLHPQLRPLRGTVGSRYLDGLQPSPSGSSLSSSGRPEAAGGSFHAVHSSDGHPEAAGGSFHPVHSSNGRPEAAGGSFHAVHSSNGRPEAMSGSFHAVERFASGPPSAGRPDYEGMPPSGGWARPDARPMMLQGPPELQPRGFGHSAPNVKCFLTKNYMEDPVIAQDGYAYEREAIQEWFGRGNNTSPVTGDVLQDWTLMPCQRQSVAPGGAQ